MEITENEEDNFLSCVVNNRRARKDSDLTYKGSDSCQHLETT